MEKVTNVNVMKIRTVNQFLKEIRSGEGVVVEKKNKKEMENLKTAQLVIKSEKFVKDYIEKNGTKSFISERLRNGFIGELIHCDNGSSYIQSVRGKPYGTSVALKTDNGVVIGLSYMDTEDLNKGHPIVGLAIALKRAIERKENKENSFDKTKVKSRSRRQIEHFEKRALSYFHPEKYSYSRGTDPVEYKDYDEIHARRRMILGK